MNKILSTIGAVLIFLYPFIIFFGVKSFGPRFLSLTFLLIILTYILPSKSVSFSKWHKYSIMVLALILLLLTQIYDSILFIKIYPVFVSLIFFTFFFITLFYPPSMIEIFARMTDKNLSEAAIKYTRNVTKIWCVFFIFNATISLYTAFFCDIKIWTFYNGFLSYILIGTLFACEYLFRIFVIKKDNAHLSKN